MKQHILEHWNTYRTQVVPIDAGVVQVQETKLAFFAGAVAMFHCAISHNPGHGGDDRSGVQRLQELEKELTAHVEAVKAGAA